MKYNKSSRLEIILSKIKGLPLTRYLIISLYIILVVLVIYLINSKVINEPPAHPGRVAEDGCHFCRTNCPSLGYTENTRHGHNGAVCDKKLGDIDPKYLP